MEREQFEKRLAWLDEQRRKDSEALGLLNGRLESLETALEKTSRQGQDLSSENARLASQMTRIHQFDDAIAKHRQEISRQLQGLEERRGERDAQIDQMRQVEREEISKALSEIRVELGGMTSIQHSLDARREEELRISRLVDSLENRVDELLAKDFGRGILSLEEGRKQDGRRLTDVQTESNEVRSKVESLRGMLDTLDDRARRIETRLAELAASENERREAQALWMEQQGLKMVEFERSWKAWERRFEAFENKAAEIDERMLAYEETYRAMKQLRGDLDKLVERLERRITEVSEMQRLSDDRTHQEWTTFQADDQRRWNSFKLGAEEQWREHVRQHEKLSVNLHGSEEALQDAQRAISSLTEASQQRLQDLASLVREWAAQVERKISEVR